MTVKCLTNSCDEDGVVRVFWPGNPPGVMCKPCEERALGIADAMGFHLHTEPVAEPPGPQDTGQ